MWTRNSSCCSSWFGISLWILGIFVSVSLVDCKHYINEFAVHIPGGERKAREIADTHGYTFLGQVIPFSGQSPANNPNTPDS